MTQLLDELRIARKQPQAGLVRPPAARRWRRKAMLVLSTMLVPVALGSWYYLVKASPLAVDVVTVAAYTGWVVAPLDVRRASVLTP